MSKNLLNNNIEERTEKRLSISEMLLNYGYFNEAVIFSWMALRETLFLSLEKLKIPYQSTTEAIFRFIENQIYEAHIKNIIFLYHLGIMAEWDRNLKIDEKDAFDIYEKSKQICEHIIKNFT